ncbi:MAG: hypothetical protein IJT43_05725 [Stomatobaculum sp.]|nr:hypothetical protein [Stomatobaculum sp.]
MDILLLVICLLVLFKITGPILRIFGKIIGGLISLVLHIILAFIIIVLFGGALFLVPVILVVGLIAILSSK